MRTVNVTFISVFIALVMVGCGSGGSSSEAKENFERISDFERVLTFEDITATGWKKGKTYDVEGLDGAEAAYVGFWSPPGLDSLNYEIRIYPSHEVAVEKGVPFAEDASAKYIKSASALGIPNRKL